MLYKHYFTFDQIQKMSYFDFKFYSTLLTNFQKQINDAIEQARQEANNKI